MITEKELLGMNNEEALETIDRAAHETFYKLLFSLEERGIEATEDLQQTLIKAMQEFQQIGIYTACITARELNEVEELSKKPRCIPFIQ